jgi:acetyl esterase/lipase
MTAAPAQLAGEPGDVRFVHQSMYYPVTDDAMDTGSYEQFAESYFPTAKAMAWTWEAGICSGAKERHPQRLDGIQRGGQRCRNHMGERRTHVLRAERGAPSLAGRGRGRSSSRKAPGLPWRMAVVSAAVWYASVGGITLYKASRR